MEKGIIMCGVLPVSVWDVSPENIKKIEHNPKI
jgi:hypothetical protein